VKAAGDVHARHDAEQALVVGEALPDVGVQVDGHPGRLTLRRSDETELEERRQPIGHAPVLDDPPVFDAEQVEDVDLHRGWSRRRYTAWPAVSLEALLLGPTPAR
jgi:hypothetical protein